MKKGNSTRNIQNICLAILINLIAFTVFISCENIFIINILPSRDSKTVKYESSDDAGNAYILVITGKTSRAAYKGAEGDSYVLTIKQQGQPDKESKGVVTTIKDDGSLTLKPTKADSVPFGVSVSSGKMTAITGTITLDNGTTVLAPGEVTPIGSITFTSVDAMAAWLNARPANTATTAYNINLNGDNFYEGEGYFFWLSGVLNDAPNKYVNIDLSGSTGIKRMHGDNFYDCPTLVSITIPASVTSIVGCTGVNAFNRCSMLVSIYVASGNTEYASVDGILVTKDLKTLISYPPAKPGAFTIPNSITNIGYYALEGTAWLDNQPDGLVYVGKIVYTYKGTMPANTNITLLADTKAIADRAFGYLTELTSITIPASVTSIGSSAFYACSSLARVTFQGTITEANFNSSAGFSGDLRAKYLAGGKGTYTTPSPGRDTSVWTKE